MRTDVFILLEYTTPKKWTVTSAVIKGEIMKKLMPLANMILLVSANLMLIYVLVGLNDVVIINNNSKYMVSYESLGLIHYNFTVLNAIKDDALPEEGFDKYVQNVALLSEFIKSLELSGDYEKKHNLYLACKDFLYIMTLRDGRTQIAHSYKEISDIFYNLATSATNPSDINAEIEQNAIERLRLYCKTIGE